MAAPDASWLHVPVPASVPPDRPFSGQQVALLGKPSVLSKRDIRALVERLGGTFSPAVTPRTTVVIVGPDHKTGREGEASPPPPTIPPHIWRTLSEDEFC